MKQFLIRCAIAICGLSLSTAYAQDYPLQYNTCCDMPFDGLYIGGNVGVFSHLAHRNDLDGFLEDSSGWTTHDIDVTAGVQLGYDWQCQNTLIGLVVDWNWVNNEHRLHENQNDTSPNFIHNEFDWFTTIRARAGLTVCDALVYVTGGAAVASFDTRWFNAPDDFHHDETRWGWTGGFGAEFLVWCNWSIGAEFLFLHFEHDTRTFAGSEGDFFLFRHDDSAWVGRIMLNYRFGDLCSWFW